MTSAAKKTVTEYLKSNNSDKLDKTPLSTPDATLKNNEMVCGLDLLFLDKRMICHMARKVG